MTAATPRDVSPLDVSPRDVCGVATRSVVEPAPYADTLYVAVVHSWPSGRAAEGDLATAELRHAVTRPRVVVLWRLAQGPWGA